MYMVFMFEQSNSRGKEMAVFRIHLCSLACLSQLEVLCLLHQQWSGLLSSLLLPLCPPSESSNVPSHETPQVIPQLHPQATPQTHLQASPHVNNLGSSPAPFVVCSYFKSGDAQKLFGYYHPETEADKNEDARQIIEKRIVKFWKAAFTNDGWRDVL